MLSHTNWENYNDLSGVDYNDRKEKPHFETFESFVYHDVLDLRSWNESCGWTEEKV